MHASVPGTRIGTCHFATIKHARSYYRVQEVLETAADARNSVAIKLQEGSIRIGKPSLMPGQKLSVDSDGRYWIE